MFMVSYYFIFEILRMGHVHIWCNSPICISEIVCPNIEGICKHLSTNFLLELEFLLFDLTRSK